MGGLRKWTKPPGGFFLTKNGATDGHVPRWLFLRARFCLFAKTLFFLQKKRIQPFSSVFTMLINLVKRQYIDLEKKPQKRSHRCQLNRIHHKKKQQAPPVLLLTMNQPFWFFSKVTIDIWTTSSNICEVDNPGISKCRSSESFVHVLGSGFKYFLFLPVLWGNDPNLTNIFRMG